ncbi:hypothetical protein CMI47_20215 [Candidatus Pacearchaeota archaeon]|nr:hypothetical protein [Candidatus Pacearchaeota archaeon]|tara:strand:- start:1983 stop:2186 length:204 start_codon:yes stop_codon:yes gene_type:complete
MGNVERIEALRNAKEAVELAVERFRAEGYERSSQNYMNDLEVAVKELDQLVRIANRCETHDPLREGI